MKRLLLLWLLLSLAAGAQEQPGFIQFDIWPEDATIGRFKERLPVRQPVPLDLQPLRNGSVTFHVSCPGCAPADVVVDPRILSMPAYRIEANLYRWPDTRFELHPLNPAWDWYYRLKSHPTATASGLLLTLFLVGWALHQRAGRRALARESQQRAEESAAAANSPDPVVQKQAHFGRHQVISSLGSGGMAQVYLGRGIDSGEQVAIKVMRPELAGQSDYRRRFQREYQVMLKLRHPNIVQLLDGGDQDGRLYLVMELIRGEPLNDQIPAEGMSLAQARPILRQILEALALAHSQGVVHRDLKPHNVMVCENGSLKVMDFGLARRDDLSQITGTGVAVGTPAYVAPEQITGGGTDARCDQYSFGVMAYQLLTGQLPFHSPDPLQMVMQQMSQAPPVPERLSPSLQRWLLKMLAKDPEARFASTTAVARALEQALEDPEAGQDWVVSFAAARVPPSVPTVVSSGESDSTLQFG